VDITAYQVSSLSPLQLRELIPPHGGPWGSTYADAKFRAFIEALLGAHLFSALPGGVCLELADGWEQVKVSQLDGDAATFRVPLATALAHLAKSGAYSGTASDIVASYNERSGSAAAAAAADGSALAAKLGSVVVPMRLGASFVDDVIADIARELAALLRDPRLVGLTSIFLLGGFANSLRLRRAVEAVGAEHGIRVFTPRTPALAVVQGALQLGMAGSSFVASRVMPRSIGVGAAAPWSEFRYDTKRGAVKELCIDGVTRVVNLLHLLVEVGQEVPLDFVAEITVRPITDEIETVSVEFYATRERGVQYYSDARCALLATLNIPCSGRRMRPRSERGIVLTLRFGRAVVDIVARDLLTGAEHVQPLTYEALNTGAVGTHARLWVHNSTMSHMMAVVH
jgi:hypothetical protein